LSNGDYLFKRLGEGVQLKAEPVVISAGGVGGVKFVSAPEGEKLQQKLSPNPHTWLLRQYLACWTISAWG